MLIKNYDDPQLNKILNKVASEFTLQKVILFGSRARKNHTPHSDYDLVIILKKSDLSPIERNQKARLLTWELGSAIDYFIYTENEFDSQKHEIGCIANEALTTGLDLDFV